MFKKKHIRTLSAAVALAALAVTTTACGSTSNANASGSSGDGTGHGGNTITFVGNWSSPNVLAIPIVTSMERGYYKKAGINLHLLLPPSNSTDVQMVGIGQAQLGASTNTDVLNAKQANLPIKAIANESAVNNWGLFYNPGTQVNADTLTSGGIGGYGDTFTKAMLPFFYKHYGVDASKAKVITVTNDDIPLLLTNKLKFATSTTNLGAVEYKNKAGHNPASILATDVGAPNSPIWVYIGNTTWLKSHKDLATKFLNATLQGTKWAVANPSDAVHLYRKHFKSTGYDFTHDLAEWQATAAILKGAKGYFTSSASQWTQLAKALKTVGELNKVLPAHSYFTNDYISASQ